MSSYRHRTSRSRRVTRAATTAGLLTALGNFAACALAQVSGSWVPQGPGANFWSNAAKWSSAPLYPDGGGTATFTTMNSATVALDRAVALASVVFDGPTVGRLDGHTYGGRLALVGLRQLHAAPHGPVTALGLYPTPSLTAPLESSAGLIKTGQGALAVNLGLPGTGPQLLHGDIDVREGALLVEQAISPPSPPPLGDPGNRVILRGTTFGPNSAVRWTNTHPILVTEAGGNVRVGDFGGELSGEIAGTGALRLTAPGYAPSQFDLALTRDNPLSGAVEYDANPWLALRGNGAFRTVPSLSLRDAGAILDNAGVAQSDRLNDAAVVRLKSAWLRLTPHPSVAVTERVGAIELTGGECTLDPQPSTSAAPLTLSATALNRTAARGTFLIFDSVGRGTAALASRIMLDEPPTLIGSGLMGTNSVGIVPAAGAWGSGELMGFVTNGSHGLRALTSSEYASALPVVNDGIARNVRLTSVGTLPGARTVNSLLLAGTSAPLPAVNGTGTLTVRSGMVAAAPHGSIDVPLEFGGREAIFRMAGRLVIGSSISGADGLTSCGEGGTLDLRGTSSFGGTVTINAGTLQIRADVRRNQPGPLGSSAEPIVIAGRSARLEAIGNLTIERDIEVRSGRLTRGTGSEVIAQGSLELSGNVGGSGALWLSGGPITVTGDVGGDVHLAISGQVRFAGELTHSGGTQVWENSSLAVRDEVSFGPGTLWMSSFASSPSSAPALRSEGAGPARVLNRVQVSTAARFVGEAPIELAGPLEMLPGVVPYPIIQNEVPVTVAGSIDGPGMEKQGPSALTIEGPLRVGVAHVRGGTLELASSTAAMRRIDLRLAGLLRLRAGGDKLLNLDDMVITDGCALDLSDNAMVIRAASDTTTGDQIRSGFAGGAWNGPGIHSSAAAADARLGIGYARADAVLDFSSGLLQSFHGVTVGPTAVLVDVALLGDANLDGSVNLRDFNKLAGNFGQSGRTWHQGDFNYDGNVNLQDFNRLAANFGLTAAGPEVTPQDWAALAVAVPEPATMAVAAPALCLMAGRARLRRGAPAVSVR